LESQIGSTVAPTNANPNSLIYWLNIAGTISAGATQTVYMIFADRNTTVWDGVNIGIAPQWTSTYGQYDNGVSVFIYYQNFAGTSIPSGWSKTSNANVIINNGLKITSTGDWAFFEYSIAFNPQTTVADFYAYATNNTIMQFGWYKPQYYIDTDSYYGLLNYNGTVGSKVAISGASYSSYQIFSIGEIDSTGSWATLNYGNMVTNTGGYTAVTSNQLAFQVLSTSDYIICQWLRVRAYPPNGVMPAVLF